MEQVFMGAASGIYTLKMWTGYINPGMSLSEMCSACHGQPTDTLLKVCQAVPTPKTLLSSRYVKFAYSLSSSKKASVRYLASLAKGDQRTLFGRTLEKIRSECGVDDLSLLTPKAVKEKLSYFSVPQTECWRINLLSELLDARKNVCEIDLNQDQITRIIEDVCTT